MRPPANREGDSRGGDENGKGASLSLHAPAGDCGISSSCIPQCSSTWPDGAAGGDQRTSEHRDLRRTGDSQQLSPRHQSHIQVGLGATHQANAAHTHVFSHDAGRYCFQHGGGSHGNGMVDCIKTLPCPPACRGPRPSASVVERCRSLGKSYHRHWSEHRCELRVTVEGSSCSFLLLFSGFVLLCSLSPRGQRARERAMPSIQTTAYAVAAAHCRWCLRGAGQVDIRNRFVQKMRVSKMHQQVPLPTKHGYIRRPRFKYIMLCIYQLVSTSTTWLGKWHPDVGGEVANSLDIHTIPAEALRHKAACISPLLGRVSRRFLRREVALRRPGPSRTLPARCQRARAGWKGGVSAIYPGSNADAFQRRIQAVCTLLCRLF